MLNLRKISRKFGVLGGRKRSIDGSPVSSAHYEHGIKSVGNGMTFDHDLIAFDEIKTGVLMLADEVAYCMRKYGVKCSVVSLTIKDSNFKSKSKQKTLTTPTHLTKEIIDVSMELIRSSWNEKAHVRSITITWGNLVSAEKWGIHMRNVQILCANGRVQGAVKFERSWLIPKTAPKPTDPRKNPAYKEQKQSKYIPYAILIDSLPFRPCEADKVLTHLNEDERRQAECEFAYLRGEFGGAKQLFLDTPEDSKLRLCATNIALYESRFFADFDWINTVHSELLKMQSSQKNAIIDQMLLDISLYVMMTVSKATDKPLDLPDKSLLPQETRKVIRITNCYHDAFELSKFEMAANILEALIDCEQGARYTMRDINMRLICGAAYNAIGEKEKARLYAEQALDLALPDGFILQISDMLVLFGDILAKCLKARSEEMYIKAIAISEQAYKIVLEYHNKFTQNNISNLLTVEEIQLAQLIKSGHTNNAIAKAQGCSIATVKRQLEVIFDKLDISKRSELENYIM